jgi:hypothetical protein
MAFRLRYHSGTHWPFIVPLDFSLFLVIALVLRWKSLLFAFFSKAGRLCIRLDFFASWLGPTCSTKVSLVCRSRSCCVHDSVVSSLDESYHDQSTHQSSLHAFTVTVTPLPQNNHATYFTALSSEPLLTRVALRLQHALGVTAT